MENERIYIPMLSVNPHGICTYWDYIGPRRVSWEAERPKETDPDTKPDRRRFAHNGIMSDHACKKLRTAIEWLNLIARKKKIWDIKSKSWLHFKVNFVTLTLPAPQRHTDQQIKSKCLNYLLIELRKFHHMRNYVWRAEKQENGNIHFHLATDSYIPADKLRQRWNRICNQFGYVDDYTAKMRREITCFADYYNKFINQGSYETLMRRYNYGKRTGWTDPNSTDIHSVKKIKDLVAYLYKYFSKNIPHPERLTDEERERLTVKGMLWGLSESLSKMKPITMVVDSFIGQEISRLFREIKSKVITERFFEFKVLDIRKIRDHNCHAIWQEITDTLFKHFKINVLF